MSLKLLFFTHLTIFVLIYLIVNLIYNYGSCVKKYNVNIAHESILKPVMTDSFACYESNSSQTLPDILDHPLPNKRIVFLETSCKSRQKLHLEPRQACSIESAAFHHPTSHILILITSPVPFGHDLTDPHDRLVHTLRKYPNIHFFHLNLQTYLEHTPVEQLYRAKLLESSPYYVNHLSDVIRFVTLWRFPGTYIDTDVIVQRNLDSLGRSFCGKETDYNVGSAVFRIGGDRRGRKWIRMLLDDLNQSYQPLKWAHNSNGLLERLLRKICSSPTVSTWNQKTCSGFRVYPKHLFYPVGFNRWYQYFNEKFTENTTRLVARSRAVHLWNKLSENQKIRIGTFESALDYIANEHCPNIYSEVVMNFNEF